MNIREIHNGVTVANQVLKFEVSDNALVIVSTQNNDSTPFELTLMGRRTGLGVADTDYVELQPQITFDNDNNYQILTVGFFGLKVNTAADIIVAVSE